MLNYLQDISQYWEFWVGAVAPLVISIGLLIPYLGKPAVMLKFLGLLGLAVLLNSLTARMVVDGLAGSGLQIPSLGGIVIALLVLLRKVRIDLKLMFALVFFSIFIVDVYHCLSVQYLNGGILVIGGAGFFDALILNPVVQTALVWSFERDNLRRFGGGQDSRLINLA